MLAGVDSHNAVAMATALTRIGFVGVRADSDNFTVDCATDGVTALLDLDQKRLARQISAADLGSFFHSVLSTRGSLHAVMPPSTAKVVPVMNEASSESRNNAALATSSGLAGRPIGVCPPRLRTSSSRSMPSVDC